MFLADAGECNNSFAGCHMPADGNVAVGSHAQYVPMLTAAAA